MTRRDVKSGMARRRGDKAQRKQPLPAGAGGLRPMVAIVGRPNVGKSTLFNRLAGRRIAIVEDVAGVTRDRHYADALAMGKEYVLVDTGGFDPDSDDPMAMSIASQVKLAIEECDIIICAVDGSVDPTPADREAVHLLRQTEKPTLFVANKADSRGKAMEAVTYYELGIDELLPVSALHGHGVGDLEEELAQLLPEQPEYDEVAGEAAPRIAIVGRPNAGKSSLVNRLLGEDRLLVDNRPGTTVDSIDSLIRHGDEELVLIDTAGMRRKRSVHGGVEGLSVIHAIRSMERSDAVILMIDAHNGVAEQDAKIAGLAEERGVAMVVALNKMDLMDAAARKKALEDAERILAFCPWAQVITVSVQTRRGLKKLMDTVVASIAEHRKRITTGQLNRFFAEVIETHPPPTQNKRVVRLYFITQAQASPPTFMVVANNPSDVHFSYRRYVVNQIRKRFGFEGTPIRVRYRKKNRKNED